MWLILVADSAALHQKIACAASLAQHDEQALFHQVWQVAVRGSHRRSGRGHVLAIAQSSENSKTVSRGADDGRHLLAWLVDRSIAALVGLGLASSSASIVAYRRHHPPHPAAAQAALPRGLPGLPPAGGGSYARTLNVSPDHPLL